MAQRLLTAFPWGEVKPGLHGRVDSGVYQSALALCRDALPQDGVRNRCGTVWHGVQSLGQVLALIPFVASSQDQYLVWLYRNATHKLRARIIYDGSFLDIGDDVELSDASLPNPLTGCVRHAQVADELNIAIPGYPVTRIIRVGHSAWSGGEVAIGEADPPHLYATYMTTNHAVATLYHSSHNDVAMRLRINRVVNGVEYHGRFSPDAYGTLTSPGDIIDRAPFDFSAGQYAYLIWNALYDTEPSSLWLNIAATTAYYYDPPTGLQVYMTEPAGMYVLQLTGGTIKPTALSKRASQALVVAETMTFAWIAHPTLGGAHKTLVVNIGGPPMTHMPDTKAVVFTHANTTWRVYGATGSPADNADTVGFWQPRTLPYLYIDAEPPFNYSQLPYDDDQDINSAAGHYPEALTITQQRAWYSGAPDWPNSLRGSRLGSLDTFGFYTPLRADDALDLPLASEQVNGVRHLLPHRGGLLLFTSGDVWLVSSQTGSLTWDAIGFTRLCAARVSPWAAPLLLDDRVVFADESGRVLELAYDNDSQAWQLLDRSEHAAHLFVGRRIVSWAWQANPGRTLWCVMNDGTLRSCTIDPGFQTWGWAAHVVVSDTSLGAGVRQVAVIGDSAGRDEVWLATARKVSGAAQTHEHIERLPHHGDTDTWTSETALFLDANKTLTSEGGTATWDFYVANAPWLSADVTVLADGQALPDTPMPENGILELGETYHRVTIGFPFTSLVKTLPINDGIGQRKVVARVALRLRQTKALEVGPDEGRMEEMKQRTTEPYDTASQLYTGTRTLELRGKWTKDGALLFRQRQPYPFAIEAAAPEYDKGE